MAYTRLMRLYYRKEAPIPADIAQACRLIRAASKEERKAVETVLGEFFELRDDGWHQARCDAEITTYQAKCERNRKVGKLGGRPRKNKTQTEPTENPDGFQTVTQTEPTENPPQTPDPRPQIYNNPNGLSSAAAETAAAGPPSESHEIPRKPGLPDCPHQQIIALWAKRLPRLTQPRSWEGGRRQAMRARWQQAAKPSAYSPNGYASEAEGLQWWDDFFAYIADETTLADGFTTNARTWRPDLEWVCNAANFQKIIDGKYDK